MQYNQLYSSIKGNTNKFDQTAIHQKPMEQTVIHNKPQ
jgi:hypothetical protein